MVNYVKMANAKWLFFTIPGSVRSTCEACVFLNEGNAFWLVIDVGHNVHLPRIKRLADTLLVPSPRCFCKGSLLGDNHRANYVDKMVCPRNIDLSLASLPHFSELLWKNKSCRKHTQQGLVVFASYPMFFPLKIRRISFQILSKNRHLFVDGFPCLAPSNRNDLPAQRLNWLQQL